MAKLENYVELAAQTAREIAADGETWRSFLQTASTLYKYGFYDQMMIYAQRPDATACASFELWTNTMRRYVRRGAKGIALLDMTGDVPRYRYVFDISDTGTRQNARTPFTWAIREENSMPIAAMLEKEYGSSANRGLAGQLEEIAMQKAMDYWQEHQDELRDIVDGSLLMEYDELNLELAFRNTATTGVQYMLFSRCGLAEEHRFEPEDFATILEWNTPQALTALGTAVSEISEEVLRSIEREARSVERSRPHAELQNGERLSDSRPENPGRAGDAGQVRQDAQGVSARAQENAVQQPAPDGRTDGASDGNRPDGGRAGEPHGQRDGGGAGRERSTEGTRPDGVGRRDEQPESAGRGNRTERAGVRLNPGQTSLFETITEYGEGADDRAVSAPSFISKALDTALRFGGNGEDTRMELAFDAMIGKTNEEIALRMKTLYHDGSGFELDGRRFSVWFDPSGIQMAAGDRARYANNAQVISWTDAAKRVGELIEAGQFGTQLENVEAPGTIRRKTAERLIYMYRDSAARENGYLSLMTDTPLIFPDCVNHLSEKMEQPEFLHGLIRQMEVFADAVAIQPDLMRFHFLLPKDILPRLRDLALARKELPEGEMLLPDVHGFMTQDEIDAVLTQSAPIAGAGSRIYQFFSAPHSTNEKLEFLKNEYGIGGKMPGVSGEHGSSESHDAKGIQLRKSNCPDVLLKWNQVAERIDRLIHDGHYLKSDAPDRKEPEISFTPDVEAYKRLKDEHPRRLVGVRVDDTLLFYGEDAQTAAPLMDTRLFERDIPGMGTISVTGMPFGRWSVAAKALTENGHGIYFAETAEQGGYEVVKELDGRRDEPSYQVGDTVYLGDTAFLIEEITDTHVNLRDPTLLYPISRVERRDTFEQMLAEDTRNDFLFQQSEFTQTISDDSEQSDIRQEPQSRTEKSLPQEEIRLHNLVIDLTGQETERKEAEPYKAQNFHILDRQGNVIWLRGATVIDAIQTSGEDAAATTDELWPGLYEIVEIAPPVGYLPSDEHVLVDTASAAAQFRKAVVTYDALKLNEIKLGAQAIVKVLGDNKTDNQHTETPEEGAEFHVYLRKAGSYENAREFERDHLITDKSGYAKTKLLPYGVYVLEQTVGKDGFEIKKPILFEITGEENPIQPPILTLNDRPILYRLRLIKTDARTGKVIMLAGASFKLKDTDGNTVTQTVYYPKKQTLDTFTTDESGCVTLPEEVGWGLYSIEEIQAPEGYLIRTESLPVFVGKTGDTADQVYELDIEIPNEAVMGQIRLEKKGLQLVGFETQTKMGFEYQSPVFEERCLAGAVFEVRAAEEIVGGDGTIWYQKDEWVDTITTSGTGADGSKELPLGKYKLIEVAAPEGYALSDEVYEVELKSIDGHTPLVTVTAKAHNEYLSAEIQLEKEKEILKPYTDADGYIRQELTTTYGLGFVFGLYNADDIHYADGMLPADTLIAVGMTDMHGKLTFSGNLPHGAYTIRELDGPKGWKLNSNRFDVRISPENQADDAPVIRVSLDGTVRNELIYTKVTLTKTDITGAETVPGAEIEVRNEQGEVIYRAVTDENGEIPDIPVTPGRYTFKEVLAPEGYALNETTCSFTVDEDGHVSGDTVLRDDFTRFMLKKVGEHKEPLAGVAFSLKDERGAVVATALTDADGIAMFEKIPYGSYTVVESKPLPGYLPSGVQVSLTLDGTFVNPTEPIAVIPNERMKLTFKKVDTAGNPLAGVAFSLIDAQNGTVVAHAVSDEKGEFEITGFTVGDWILREDEAPEGFNLMDDYPFHVGYNWKNDQTVTLVNIPNHYEFEKTDHRRKPLFGVRFGLYDDKGTFIRELVSDENGIVRADNLVPGSYLIRETRPLDGYARTDEAITFTIDESYVPPQKLARITNTPVIQTGVDFPIAPSMVVGLLMMAASVLLGLMRLLKKKHR